jgi:diguanylate cyclase (GGDEF)-like protein
MQPNCPTVFPGIVRPQTNRVCYSPFVYERPSDGQVKDALIMIVDDEESVPRTIRKYLFDMGFNNFHLVNDSTQAVKQISQSNPDLILLDLHMPVHGMDILREIRQQESTQRIPVITLTSDTDAETRIQALSQGADDFLTKPVDISELGARVRNTLSGKIYRDQLARYTMELEYDVLRDSLTKVANRRGFEYEVSRRVFDWLRKGTPLSLLFIDIDFFKSVNDRYGHQVGDRVLHKIALSIQNSVRSMDLVSRYGGEEFAVLLHCCRADEAKVAAERIRRDIELNPIQVEGKTLSVTISIGLSTSIVNDDPEMLVLRADQALYAAKQNGRNCCQFNDGENCSGIFS